MVGKKVSEAPVILRRSERNIKKGPAKATEEITGFNIIKDVAPKKRTKKNVIDTNGNNIDDHEQFTKPKRSKVKKVGSNKAISLTVENEGPSTSKAEPQQTSKRKLPKANLAVDSTYTVPKAESPQTSKRKLPKANLEVDSTFNVPKAKSPQTSKRKLPKANLAVDSTFTVPKAKHLKKGIKKNVADIQEATKPKRGVSKTVELTEMTESQVKRKNKVTALTKGKKAKNIKPEPIDDNDDNQNELSELTKSGPSKIKSEPKDENEISSAKGSKKGKDANSKSSAKDRVFVKKGKAPVDGLCPIAAHSRVYCEYDDTIGEDEIWDCMLNQTNIQFNNNKFYLIQLLCDDFKENYSVWMRWGRVGANGQNCLTPCASNLEKAKDIFMKKFQDKTKNPWEFRHSFEKVPGKYDLLKMDYDSVDDIDAPPVKEEESTQSVKKVESKLSKQVQLLIELICDVKAMEMAVMEMKYDAKKAPLGKLTTEQVLDGFKALKSIADIIGGSGKIVNKNLVEASNIFYTRIPHYFGMKVPPVIRTKEEIREKMQLLESLTNIQAAMNILGNPVDENTHPTDQHYNDLNCDITSLDKSGEEYQILEEYLRTTHGHTHTMYKLEILEIFRVTKVIDSERFNDVGNRMLLWHGSRLTNWAGILGRGLLIAPPAAPVTGYMFGKGIYFADMASKSANYCMANRVDNVGLLILCDVALGKSKELLHADYQADKLPSGYHSVKGLGKYAPKSENYTTMSSSSDEKVIVPMGPAAETNVENSRGYTLQYNEYIVYNVNQVQIKYLFKVKFNFV